MDKIFPPWTAEQVRELNRFQRFGQFHPFTCPEGKGHAELQATKIGWLCLDCDYTQDWAWAFMAVNSNLVD